MSRNGEAFVYTRGLLLVGFAMSIGFVEESFPQLIRTLNEPFSESSVVLGMLFCAPAVRWLSDDCRYCSCTVTQV